MNEFNPEEEDLGREYVKARVSAAAEKVSKGEPLSLEDGEWLFAYVAALELRSAILSAQLALAKAALEALLTDNSPESGGLDIEFENN